jgi:outer membrane receptor for monomeric catechols
MGIYSNEKEIPNMENNDFLNWKISINYQIDPNGTIFINYKIRTREMNLS